MADFIVHGVPGSPYVRCALLVLEEKGAAYRFAPMPFGGAAKTPEHLALHPFGRVPVLQHGDFTLYETQAILRYVDRAVPGAAPLQPADPRAAARMDQLIGITDWYLFPQVSATLGWQRLIVPMLLGGTPDEAIIAAAVPYARTAILEIGRLKGAAPYMTGEALSLADLQLVPQLDFLALTPECAPLIEEAGLADWLARMRARPSLQATTMERLRAAA